MARILRQRDAGTPPCRNVRAIAEEKLAELDRRIAETTAMREELAGILGQWDAKIATTPVGEPALLLQSLQQRSKE